MSNTVQVIVKVQDQASSALSGITGALGNMASVAGGIIAADVLGQIGSGLMSVAQSGFDFNRSIENATARLNAFTKDSAVSAGILEELRIEAAKTPFAFEDMANAGTNLLPVANQLNMDLMDLVRTAEVLAASNPAEGLTGAAFALKEAASGDFTSIIERFNLSRSAINALKEEGVPNMEIVARAMADMGLDMDLVSNLSTTFDGRMSTLKDTITTLAGTFTQPIFESFSMGLLGMQGTLEENMPAIEQHLANAGRFVADAITSFRQGWEGNWVDDDIIQPGHRVAGIFGTNIRNAVDGAGRAFDDFNQRINDLKTTWEGSSLVSNFQSLNRAGDEWNDLMRSGQQLWNALIGAVNAFGFNLEIASTNTGVLYSWGGRLENALKDLRVMVDFATMGMNVFAMALQAIRQGIDWVIQGWIKLRDLMLAGLPNVVPALPSPGNALPGGTLGLPPSVVPPPNVAPPVTQQIGGVVPKGMEGVTGNARAGDTFIFNVNNQMDLEEVAYRIQKIKDAR